MHAAVLGGCCAGVEPQSSLQVVQPTFVLVGEQDVVISCTFRHHSNTVAFRSGSARRETCTDLQRPAESCRDRGRGVKAQHVALSTSIDAWLCVQVVQPTFVLVGEQDIMIPSAAEAARLDRLLPNCRSKELPGRSHALLQEAGVSLMDEVDAAGFFVPERNVTGSVEAASARRMQR